MKQRTAAVRLSAVRAVLGMGDLVFARRTGTRTRRVIGVLGARQLVQAALTGARPTAAVLAVGAGVDALHAASMLALGAFRRDWRTPALTDAAVAAGLAVLGAAARRTGS